MPKYFMWDTRLSGLERMMMDPPRSASAEPERNRPRKKAPASQPLKIEQKPKEEGV